MELSTHAANRMAQRGISKEMLNIIFKYGEIENAGNGCQKVFLGKRECNIVVREIKRLMRGIDNAKNGCVVFTDDTVVTIYKVNV